MKTTPVSLLAVLLLTAGIDGLNAQAPLRADGSPDNSPEASKPLNPPEAARPVNPPTQARPINPPEARLGTRNDGRVNTPAETTTTPRPNPPPDTRPVTPVVVDPALPEGLSLQAAGSQLWTQARGYTFADRARFLTLFSRFRSRIERAVAEVKEKRLSFRGQPEVWDAQMKLLDDAYAYFENALKELNNATVADWDAGKEKLAVGWEKVATAYERARDLVPEKSSS